MRTILFLAIAALFGILALPAAQSQSVTTYHNDSQRTGWNSNETILTPSIVSTSFGRVATVGLDDQVDTQPLVVLNQAISGQGVHSVAYVTTESNTVYAIDADTGALLLPARNLGSAVPRPLGCTNNGPNVGINGTATIDVAAGILFVIAYINGPSGPEYDLHALNLTTLQDRAGSPVVVHASQTLNQGNTFNFNAAVQRQRPGLLDANGKIYAGFGSFCDFRPDQARGWLLSWDKATFAPQPNAELTNRLSVSNANQCTGQGPPCFLSAIWMSGYGPSSDSAGNVYFTTGNSAAGTYGSFNFAESAMKMPGALSSLTDFFTPSNESSLDAGDTDFGSGGLMVLPDQPGSFPHLAVAAGKEGKLFILNRDNMGGFNTTDFPNNVQVGGCWCGPSYFQDSSGGHVVSSGGTQVKLWSLATAGGKPSLSLVGSAPAFTQGAKPDPGFFTSVSSNGTTSGTGIIWAVGGVNGTDNHISLFAYNATPSGGTLPLLFSDTAGNWSSNQANSNIVPTVANGKVYVASDHQLQIFGVRPPTDVSIWRYTGTPCNGSCTGWQQLDNNTKTVSIVSDGNLYQLHNDGMIWKSNGTPCTGTSCPGWQMLDDNPKGVAIAADGGNLYQLHNDGMIWKYTGTPCSGTSCPGWQMLDDNPKGVAIAAGGSNLYQLHNDGMIWKFTGTPCSGTSCPGWQMLDNNTKAIAIAADASNLYQLHNDGMIWRFTGTPCSGTSCPGWQMLDDNTKAAAIAASGGNLYQLHNDGMIWKFTGTPCSGTSCPGWQLLDDNTKSVRIVADGGNLFQLHNDGMIWQFTGTPCSGASCPGWQLLDENIRTTRIVSGGGQLNQLHADLLYQLHNDGSIWRYVGEPCEGSACPGWQMLDNNPVATAIATAGRDLFQLHNHGSIWRYIGTPCSGTSCPGWQMLDNNPTATSITAAGHDLFQLHSDGSIWRYTGTPCGGTSCPGWQMLDNNPAATAITAAGRQLFQLHNDGSIWRYIGTPCSGSSCPGWQMLDNNPAATAITGGDQLFQLHNNGSIWRYTGTPCSGTSCPGWQMLDNNPAATAITAAGRQLFQLHNNGSIWRYTGTPCSGSSCPGWQMLDNNPAATAITGGDQLFQLHNNGSIWRYTGTPCSGASCPGWQMLDTNAATTKIKASYMQ